MEQVVQRFVNILVGSQRGHGKWVQINVSAADLKALNYFASVFDTILRRLGDLIVTVERTVENRLEFRGGYGRGARGRFAFYNRREPATPATRKVIEKHLDVSEAAKATISLVHRLLGKMDLINLRINQQQCEDICLEVSRYTKMVDLCKVLRDPLYSSNKDFEEVKTVREKIEKILFGFARFTSEQHEIVNGLFRELEKALKTERPLSKEEKQMIHLAMAKDFYGGSQSKGHWFTCSRGHYYCITECGGAMQESKCPECGEKIGGQQHRYVPTMRLASDMDGATRPAWSTGYDLRNYRL